MQYIKNLEDEPKTLPSQVGATVINNPTEEVVKSLGFIPISGTRLVNDFESDAPKKVEWLRNEETAEGVVAVYHVMLDAEALRNKEIADENQRYMDVLTAGYDTGLGFNISMHKNARDLFREIMDGITYAQLPDDAEFTRLKDTTGKHHTVTIKQMKAIAKGFSIACILADTENDLILETI